jgi:uncharacterized protein
MISRFLARMGGIAVIVALVFGLAGEAAAQTQAQPSAGALAAAREYIIAKGAGTMFDSVVAGTIERTKGFFLQTNTALSKDLNEVAAQLRNEMANKRDEVIDVFAQAVAVRFTEQEMKDAATFYKTPLGQKLTQQEPVALDDGMKRVRTWSEDFAEQVAVRMRAEMKKRGHTI